MQTNIILNERNSFVSLSLKDLLELDLITPNVQRNINQTHVDDIIKHQIGYYKIYNELDFGNALTVAKIKNKKSLYLLDGQHRLSALRRFSEVFENVDDLKVVYFIKIVNDLGELKCFFKNISNNMPLDEWHLEILNEADETEMERLLTSKEKTDQIVKLFETNYPGILRITNRPQKPNISRDNFCRLVLQIIDDEKDSDVEQIYKEVEMLNDQMNETFKKATAKLSIATCVKFEKSKCYLSLVDFNFSTKYKIPKYIRKNVWDKYFPKNTEGNCIMCKEPLTCFSFEVGHIVSEYNGGLPELDNLCIIDSMCNKSLGKNNIDSSFFN